MAQNPIAGFRPRAKDAAGKAQIQRIGLEI
jgi:hypothetical protein